MPGKSRRVLHIDHRKIDRILRLAWENMELMRRERMHLLLMARALQGIYSHDGLALMLPKRKRALFDELLRPRLADRSGLRRRRAWAAYFHLIGIHTDTIAEFMGYEKRTVRRLMKKLDAGNHEPVLRYSSRAVKKHLRKDYRDKVFSVMHEPPSQYGINRTTWTIDLLRDVIAEQGTLIGKNTISKMIKTEGYVFRKTREVLTSNDPHYKDKLARITRILRRLGPADRFFSIDEYGPFSVKERGGRRRVRKGEYPTVPQFQYSKGNVIITAALELGTNQLRTSIQRKKIRKRW